MLKKISLIAATAASLSVVAYLAITVSMALQSEPGTAAAMQSATLRYHDGMDAMQFARELDADTGSNPARSEILALLQRHTS